VSARPPPPRRWRCARAEYGRTVVVLTIDPAKRLAQALGIKDLGNSPQRVPLAPEVTGELQRDDAGHAEDVRRDGGVVLRRRAGGRHSGEPVLPNGRDLACWHAGVHGHGEAGSASGRGQVGSSRRGHSAVAQCARLPRRTETARQLHGQPPLAPAASPWPGHRSPGHRRGRLGHEGALDRAGLSNAFGRSGFRAGTGFYVQRVPREGGPHLRVVEATGYAVRRHLRRRAGRIARGVLLRRPSVEREDCRSPG